MRFLREINEKTVSVSQELLDVPEISEALQLAEETAYNEGELNAYETSWDQVSRERTFSTSKYSEGLKQGIEQGQDIALRKIALAMLNQNEPLDKIALFTGLSLKEIESIKVN